MRGLGLPISHFCFTDTATPEIYTLSLHDALPISGALGHERAVGGARIRRRRAPRARPDRGACRRSEEHTSELQSQSNLVCRLLLEKKMLILVSMRCC